DYIERHGMPTDIPDLMGRTLIGYDKERPFLRDASQRFGGVGRRDFAIRCDSNYAQLAMIRAGAGIGVCQVSLAGRGEALIRVLPDTLSMSLEAWLTMHEDLRNSPRCRVVFDALALALAEHVAAASVRAWISHSPRATRSLACRLDSTSRQAGDGVDWARSTAPTRPERRLGRGT